MLTFVQIGQAPPSRSLEFVVSILRMQTPTVAFQSGPGSTDGYCATETLTSTSKVGLELLLQARWLIIPALRLPRHVDSCVCPSSGLSLTLVSYCDSILES